MAARQTEQQLHRQVASFLALALPIDAFWTTFPAGGGGRFRGAQLKRAGLTPGVPDIMILHKGRALFIELKTEKGRVSLAQQDAHRAIMLAGGAVAICRTLDDIVCALTQWNVPMRIKIGGTVVLRGAKSNLNGKERAA